MNLAASGIGSGTVFGLPTWLVLLAVVVVVVLALASGGRGGKRGRKGGGGGRGGRILGLPVLLVVGLLLGATVLGGTAVRTAVTAFVHAVVTLGGLFGG